MNKYTTVLSCFSFADVFFFFLKFAFIYLFNNYYFFWSVLIISVIICLLIKTLRLCSCYFRVAFCLGFKMSQVTKPFKNGKKLIWFTRKGNQGVGKTCVCMNGLAPWLDHFETEEERTPKCHSEYNYNYVINRHLSLQLYWIITKSSHIYWIHI